MARLEPTKEEREAGTALRHGLHTILVFQKTPGGALNIHVGRLRNRNGNL
jgi:hypothetical protein